MVDDPKGKKPAPRSRSGLPKPPVAASTTAAKRPAGRELASPLLVALGERVRMLRARRGMTRRAVSIASEVSERHLANLEYGIGNASILVLQQVARALDSSVAELAGDVSTSSPEWLMIREALRGRTEAELRQARIALGELFGGTPIGESRRARSRRIALVGLRGAGKSTLGQRLAEAMDVPFVELSREIEKTAGCSIREIHDLYGSNAYRRYERRALDETLGLHAEAVIAMPGGIVAEPATFNQLLTHCTTVWLQAAPEEHMARVTAQGDTRPMAASREAMEDLRRILAGREAFYAKADLVLDTSGKTVAQSVAGLRRLVASVARRVEMA